MISALLGLFVIAWGVYGVWVMISMTRRLLRGKRFSPGVSGDKVDDG